MCKMRSFHLSLHSFKHKITRISRVSSLFYSWLEFTSNKIWSHWPCHSIWLGTKSTPLATSQWISYEKKHFASEASGKLNHALILWRSANHFSFTDLSKISDFGKKGTVPFLVQSPHSIMPRAWFWFSLALIHCWMMMHLYHFWPWHFWKVGGYCCVDHPVCLCFWFLCLLISVRYLLTFFICIVLGCPWYGSLGNQLVSI